MGRALTYIVVATAVGMPCNSAQRRSSWDRILYVGGTVQVKASRFDFNTTLAVTSDAIVISIAPATIRSAQQTVHIKFSQLISLSAGAAAWRRVAEVDGSQLPLKPPTVFGLLQDRAFLGLVYQTDDGKRAAILLDSFNIHYTRDITLELTKRTGKPVENSP